MVELFKRRRLLNARWTLAPPEVQQHHLASVVCQVNSVLPVVYCEIGGHLVRISWTCAAITAAGQRQRYQRTKSNEFRKSHIFIIRSDRS